MTTDRPPKQLAPFAGTAHRDPAGRAARTRPRPDLSVHPVPPTDLGLRPLDEIVAAWADGRLEDARARPCACGGIVVASPNAPEPGVRAHQAEPRHRAWVEETFE